MLSTTMVLAATLVIGVINVILLIIAVLHQRRSGRDDESTSPNLDVLAASIAERLRGRTDGGNSTSMQLRQLADSVRRVEASLAERTAEATRASDSIRELITAFDDAKRQLNTRTGNTDWNPPRDATASLASTIVELPAAHNPPISASDSMPAARTFYKEWVRTRRQPPVPSGLQCSSMRLAGKLQSEAYEHSAFKYEDCPDVDSFVRLASTDDQFALAWPHPESTPSAALRMLFDGLEPDRLRDPAVRASVEPVRLKRTRDGIFWMRA